MRTEAKARSSRGARDLDRESSEVRVRAPTLSLGVRVELGLSLDGCELTSDD